jgi:signal transduction histidine kinase/ABC-type uncharacterized transport system substrate-binding protein
MALGYRIHFFVILLLLSVVSLWHLTPVSRAGEAPLEKKRVLILHSFHQGQKWNDDLSRGILDTLKDDALELHFEYMDAKRYPDTRHFENLYRLYQLKYQSHPVDVVISTDESALDFLLEYREDLFPGASIVFCGVKYLDDNKLFGEKQITGVTEQVDIEKNIQLMLRLNKKIKYVLVITDNSPTSISTIKSFVPLLKRFKETIEFKFTELMTIEKLEGLVESLPSSSAVLLVNYTRDRAGIILTTSESALMISRKSPVPVYALWDSYLKDGILGGLLVSGYSQGKTAANMARALLAGADINHIPVQKGRSGFYMFDYQQLNRFQISLSALPTDSILVNQPVSLYHQYKKLIFTVILGIFALTLIIVILSFNIFKRKRVERSLKNSSHRLSLMHEIDQAILNSLSIEFVADRLMEPMHHIFNTELIGILLVVPGGHDIKVFARNQQTEGITNQEIGLAVEMVPLEVLKKGLTVHTADYPLETASFVRQINYGSSDFHCLLTPLIFKKRLLGALILGSKLVDLSDNSVHERTWEVADSLAVAAQNNQLLTELRNHEEELRRMSASIIDAQEAERKRLSVELHDEFGQILTAVGLNLSLIRNKLGDDCSRTVADRLNQTEAAIENLYDQIRDLSLDLRPTILDDLGLIPTLRWFLNQYEERSGTRVSFAAEESSDIVIPGPIAVSLYRILQEALTNITKHAQANRISARLIVDPAEIQLIVSDDGVGFNLNEIITRKIEVRGLGLIGMRERIELLGGALKIETGNGNGTTLKATVPIKN